jgi:hypothetical protein
VRKYNDFFAIKIGKFGKCDFQEIVGDKSNSSNLVTIFNIMFQKSYPKSNGLHFRIIPSVQLWINNMDGKGESKNSLN